MDKEKEIVWVMMAFLHQSLILERAYWLVFNLGKKESEEISSYGILPGEESQDEKYEKCVAKVLRYSTELNTHRRAFSYVAAADGIDPDLLMKNLPGNPGAFMDPGNHKIMSVIWESTNNLVGGIVNQDMLHELVHYYELHLMIFRAKFDEIESDEQDMPVESW